MNQLSRKNTPSLSASIPQLMASCGQLDEPARDCVAKCLTAEMERSDCPRFGLDITANRFRPVAQCMSAALGLPQ